jgi:protein-tyrosine phosphatase
MFTHPETGSVLKWGCKEDAMSPPKSTTHIINVAHTMGVTLRNKHKRTHIKYFEFAMVDDSHMRSNDVLCKEMATISKHAVLSISNAMNTNNAEILVNCFAGRNRSAAVIIAYLMQEDTWTKTLGESIHYLKNKKPGSVENKCLVDVCTNAVKPHLQI